MFFKWSCCWVRTENPKSLEEVSLKHNNVENSKFDQEFDQKFSTLLAPELFRILLLSALR